MNKGNSKIKTTTKNVNGVSNALLHFENSSSFLCLRRGLAVVSLGSAIFAVGGLDDSSCFDTVERYDTMEDQWTSVASMNHRRGGAGLVALEVSLYTRRVFTGGMPVRGTGVIYGQRSRPLRAFLGEKMSRSIINFLKGYLCTFNINRCES